jgi:tetratricopeptide (TPR) repeat protein
MKQTNEMHHKASKRKESGNDEAGARPSSHNSTGRTGSPRRTDWKVLVPRFLPYMLIVCTGFALYWHTLDYPLEALDEPEIIVWNLRYLTDNTDVQSILTRDAFLSQHGYAFYRPVQNLSFWADARIWHGSVFGFRFMNLLLHCLACLLLYLFLRVLKFDLVLSAFLTATYLFHPMFTHVAVWMPARGDILIVVFGIPSFIFFMKYYQTAKPLFAVLHLILFFFTMYSKETAIVFPFIILSYHFIYRSKQRVSFLFLPLAGEIAVIISYVLIRQSIVLATVGGDLFGIKPLLMNLGMIPEVVAKYFNPFTDLSPMAVFSNKTTLIGMVFLIIIALVVWRWKMGKPKERQMLFFGIWFLAFLVPGMMFRQGIAPNAYDYLQHRMYLPSIGLVVIFGLLISSFPWRKFLLPAGIIYLGCMIFVAEAYSRDYRNGIAYYDAVILANPKNALAYHCRATLKSKQRDFQGALNDYSSAILIAPEFIKPLNSRGVLRYEMNQYDSALIDYAEVIRRAPNMAGPYNERGAIEYKRKQYVEALADFNKAIALDPALEDAYNNRAAIEAAFGNIDDAIKDYEKAISLKPDHGTAINNLKSLKQFRADNPQTRAKGNAVQTMQIPASNQAGVNKAMAGDYRGAIVEFSRLIKNEPGNADAYANRGNAKYALHDTAGAIGDWKKAANLGNKQVEKLLQNMQKR